MAGRKSKAGMQIKCEKDMKSFIRRKAGVMKKAWELSVLCGVQVAVVIFGADKSTPHVWPPSLVEFYGIIRRYLDTSHQKQSKSNKAMKKQESLTVEDQKEVKNTSWVDEVDGLSIEKLIDLVANFDAKLEKVNSRIDMMKRAHQNPPLSQVGNVEKVVPLNFQFPVENNNNHQELYSDEEEASMILNSVGGFSSSISGDYNNYYYCDYGSGVVGIWGDPNVPATTVLPLYAERPMPNLVNGNLIDLGEEQDQSASSYSNLAPWEKMLL